MEVLKSRIVLWIALVFAVLLGWWVLRPSTTNLNDQKVQAKGVSVEVVEAKKEKLTRKINTIGTIISGSSIVVKAEVNGRISKIHFSDGVAVKKGDPIISFDSELEEVALRQHEIELSTLKADLEKKEKLYDQKILSLTELQKVRLEFERVKAQRDGTKLKIVKSTIIAPFDGVMGIRNQDVNVGAVINPGQEIVALVSMRPINVDFRIPGSYSLNITKGQAVEVKIEGFPEPFIAAVEALDARVESTGHSLLVRASLPNEDNQLRPGMFAKISVIVGEEENAITIPEAAVENEQGKEYVYIVVNGAAQLAPVVTGTREKGRVEILKGIKESDVIVITGQNMLSDGMPVRVVKSADSDSLNNTDAE